ncbi:MAG: hypothetical protein ABI400_12680 [Lacisediminihabitans sp.]
MTIAPFTRRWVVLTLGCMFLLLGVVVLFTHLTLAFGWAARLPMYDMAFYPGLPSTPSVLRTGQVVASAGNYASLGGQISIALGVTLLAGWVGFTLGSSRKYLHRS